MENHQLNSKFLLALTKARRKKLLHDCTVTSGLSEDDMMNLKEKSEVNIFQILSPKRILICVTTTLIANLHFSYFSSHH